MSVRNYLTPAERHRIDNILNDLLFSLQKSYPEDDLIGIVEGAIPGVRIVEDDFNGDGSIRGAIYKKSPEYETPMIVLQKSLNPTGKTYALAHELGHYMLDHPGGKNFLLDKMVWDGSMRQQLEAQAQYFAAALLMPRDRFLQLAKVVDDYKLAERFGVSVAAVRVRKDWLRL